MRWLNQSTCEYNSKQQFVLDNISVMCYLCLLVRDAYQHPEEKRLIWWWFSQVVEFDRRNSSWAAGEPWSPEALPSCPEGRPARRGELQVSRRLCRSAFNNLFEIIRDSGWMFVVIWLPGFPAGVTNRRVPSCPVQSHVLMEKMTFLMTYKVCLLIITHSLYPVIL